MILLYPLSRMNNKNYFSFFEFMSLMFVLIVANNTLLYLKNMVLYNFMSSIYYIFILGNNLLIWSNITTILGSLVKKSLSMSLFLF